MSDDDRDIDVDSDVSNRGDTIGQQCDSFIQVSHGSISDACFVFHNEEIPNATISRKVTTPILGKPLRDRPVGANIFHRLVLDKFLETL